MCYYSKLCDKTMKNSSKYKHNKSENHINLENRNIRRYIITNPDFDRVHEIVRKNANIYNKKYNKLSVLCLFKMLTKTKTIKYIRLSLRCLAHYLYCLLSKLMTNIISKEKDNLSQILEMRITFVSQFSFMTYIYYLKQKKPMCEIKLNQIMNRNPSFIKLLDKHQPHPMIYCFYS